MVTGRAARGLAPAGAGQAGPGPENPGPRALRAETGPKFFLFKSPLCNGKFNFC